MVHCKMVSWWLLVGHALKLNVSSTIKKEHEKYFAEDTNQDPIETPGTCLQESQVLPQGTTLNLSHNWLQLDTSYAASKLRALHDMSLQVSSVKYFLMYFMWKTCLYERRGCKRSPRHHLQRSNQNNRDCDFRVWTNVTSTSSQAVIN